MTIRILIGDILAELTTDHASSSYGIPVLVYDGTAYGQGDVLPSGESVAHAVNEAAKGLAPAKRREAQRWSGMLASPGRKRTNPPQARINWQVDADVVACLEAEHARTGEPRKRLLRLALMLAYPKNFDHN